MADVLDGEHAEEHAPFDGGQRPEASVAIAGEEEQEQEEGPMDLDVYAEGPSWLG